jgi:putative sterol carrier protein
MSLQDVTERLESRLPEFTGMDARVKFVLEGGDVILIDARAIPPTISNDDGDAHTTIRLTEDRLIQLLDGRLSPTLAYTLGQIKIEGSLGVAMKLANLLDS